MCGNPAIAKMLLLRCFLFVSGRKFYIFVKSATQLRSPKEQLCRRWICVVEELANNSEKYGTQKTLKQLKQAEVLEVTVGFSAQCQAQLSQLGERLSEGQTDILLITVRHSFPKNYFDL